MLANKLEEKQAKRRLKHRFNFKNMDSMRFKRKKETLRHKRVRSRVFGTAEQPRLNVKRSLKYILLQLINDETKKTIASAWSKGLKADKENPYRGKIALAYETGLVLSKLAREKGVIKICFDRGGRSYHGRVKAAADGARAGGLIF